MNQKEFTDYIIPKIIDRFPQFKDFCTDKSNDIIDINYESTNRKLIFWLTTQDREITLGFTHDNKSDWHIHFTQYTEDVPDEQLESIIEFIKNLLYDEKIIVHSNISGYWVAEDKIDEIIKENEENEIIEFFIWSEL